MIYQSAIDIIRNDSAQALTRMAKYNNPVEISELQQHRGRERSAGYGSIELLARYFGLAETPVPDRDIERRTNRQFLDELRRVFPEYIITRHSNLRNSELIDLIYDTLEAGNPVIIFHAVQEPETGNGEDDTQSEMRYSVAIGVDLHNNSILLSDPNGTILRYTLNDFVRSARFEDYEMTIYERIAFAFRIYSKNTIFVIEPEQAAPS
jgi:hypothetical protein